MNYDWYEAHRYRVENDLIFVARLLDHRNHCNRLDYLRHAALLLLEYNYYNEKLEELREGSDKRPRLDDTIYNEINARAKLIVDNGEEDNLRRSKYRRGTKSS